MKKTRSQGRTRAKGTARASDAPARASDAAVKKATGKDWAQWFARLDKAGAKKMDHKAIAAHLYDELGCPGWWSQMVAVAYEQERGLRAKHEKPDGFEISRGKTIDVALSDLYAAWSNKKVRDRWLGEPRITVRKATPKKSMRITWSDGQTSVSVNFYAKGAKKSQVTVQHGKLSDADQAEKKKAWWEAKLEKLKAELEG